MSIKSVRIKIPAFRILVSIKGAGRFGDSTIMWLLTKPNPVVAGTP